MQMYFILKRYTHTSYRFKYIVLQTVGMITIYVIIYKDQKHVYQMN